MQERLVTLGWIANLVAVATYVHVGCLRSAQFATYADREKATFT